MTLKVILQRFALPGFIVSLYYFWKYGCLISPRAEVEVGTDLRIGRGVRVGSYTKIKAGDGWLTIGAGTSIGSGCSLSSGKQGVKIGEHCLIGPNVTILGSNYRYDRLDKLFVEQEMIAKGVRIGDNVWVGAGVVILDGSDIGSGSILTPNSVVSGTIQANVVVQGTPGKIIFERR